jgi:signal transduction histidine kinase
MQRNLFAVLVHILIATTLLLAVARTGEAASPLVLSSAQRADLAGHMDVLADPSRKLTLADVLSTATADRFTPAPANVSKGYTQDAVWVRLSVIRDERFPEHSWLRLIQPFLDYVTVYLQTGADPDQPSSYREIKLGDHIPVAERPVHHQDFLVPLQLQAAQPIRIYIRVRTNSSLNLGGSIHTSSDLLHHNNFVVIAQGGYLAVAMVIALMHLVYFIRSRDKLFLLFALYACSLFTMHTASEGIINLVWPSRAHLLSDYMTGMGTGVAVAVFALFAQLLFSAVMGAWSQRYFRFMTALGAVTAAASPTPLYSYTAPLLLLGTMTMIIVMLRLSFRAVKAHEPGGRIYLAAFGISNVGYLAHFFRLLGVVPLAWWNSNSVQAASFVNMILMSLALTERLWAAEQNALKAARESEQRAVALAEEMTVELRLALNNEKQALERQSSFLAMLSHEYRTPLAIIQANLNLLELQDAAEERGQEQKLSTMKHAVSRLIEVMEVSLQRNRVTSLAKEPLREHIELVSLLDSVIDKAEGLWPERVFVFDPVDGEVSVTGESSLLHTAVLNLLDNACKYSPPDTPVTLECVTTETTVAITVSDLGRGMGEDSESTLFGKFCRGSNSSGTGGAGLGLWIVRQIAEQHRGSVSLEPNRPVGIKAILRIPLIC